MSQERRETKKKLKRNKGNYLSKRNLCCKEKVKRENNLKDDFLNKGSLRGKAFANNKNKNNDKKRK